MVSKSKPCAICDGLVAEAEAALDSYIAALNGVADGSTSIETIKHHRALTEARQRLQEHCRDHGCGTVHNVKAATGAS